MKKLAKNPANGSNADKIEIDGGVYLTPQEMAYFQKFKEGKRSYDIIKEIWDTEDHNKIYSIWTALIHNPSIIHLKKKWAEELKYYITKEYLLEEYLKVLNSCDDKEKVLRMKAIDGIAKLLNMYTDKVDMNLNIKFGIDEDDIDE